MLNGWRAMGNNDRGTYLYITAIVITITSFLINLADFTDYTSCTSHGSMGTGHAINAQCKGGRPGPPPRLIQRSLCLHEPALPPNGIVTDSAIFTQQLTCVSNTQTQRLLYVPHV